MEQFDLFSYFGSICEHWGQGWSTGQHLNTKEGRKRRGDLGVRSGTQVRRKETEERETGREKGNQRIKNEPHILKLTS